MHLLSSRVVARLAGLGLLGVLVAVVGTPLHRARPPLGVLLALVLVLCAGVLARAWAGWAGMLVFALVLTTTVGVLAARGPGGDILIAAQPVGYVWYGGAAVVLLAALAPRAWFSDRPIGDAGA